MSHWITLKTKVVRQKCFWYYSKGHMVLLKKNTELNPLRVGFQRKDWKGWIEIFFWFCCSLLKRETNLKFSKVFFFYFYIFKKKKILTITLRLLWCRSKFYFFSPRWWFGSKILFISYSFFKFFLIQLIFFFQRHPSNSIYYQSEEISAWTFKTFYRKRIAIV